MRMVPLLLLYLLLLSLSSKICEERLGSWQASSPTWGLSNFSVVGTVRADEEDVLKLSVSLMRNKRTSADAAAVVGTALQLGQLECNGQPGLRCCRMLYGDECTATETRGRRTVYAALGQPSVSTTGCAVSAFRRELLRKGR